LNKTSRWQDKAYVLANRGRTLSQLDKKDESLDSYKEALIYLDKALEINPSDLHSWMLKGICLYKLGYRDRPMECFDKAIKIEPGYDFIWYLKGSALDYIGKHEEAINHFDKAIENNQNDADYWTSKGISLRFEKI
jgi:tetratricopeptide (TPR) repeat protein